MAKQKNNKEGKTKQIYICLQDESGNNLTKGTIIKLIDADFVPLKVATELIENFTASTVKEDNALVVTAHLSNGETLSDIYATKAAKDFYPDLAVDSSKMKLTHQVWEMLQTMYAFAAKD